LRQLDLRSDSEGDILGGRNSFALAWLPMQLVNMRFFKGCFLAMQQKLVACAQSLQIILIFSAIVNPTSVNAQSKPKSQTSCNALVKKANDYFESTSKEPLREFALIDAKLPQLNEWREKFQVVEQSQDKSRCEMASIYLTELGRLIEIFEWKDSQWLPGASGLLVDWTIGTYDLLQIKRQNFFNGTPVLKIRSGWTRNGAGFGNSGKGTDYYAQKGEQLFLLMPGNGVSESNYPAGEGCNELNKYDHTLRVMGKGLWPDIQVTTRELIVYECEPKKKSAPGWNKESTSNQTWIFDSKQYQVKKP
jgi:hypothetical protein